MTQAAQTPLEALNETLHKKLTESVTLTAADVGHLSAKLGFYEALDHLEAEGHALLQSAETKIEDAGHTIFGIGEHAVRPVVAAPHRLDLAIALPMARANDILHESEHAIVRAFMDADNVIRHVYLNLIGLWVKA